MWRTRGSILRTVGRSRTIPPRFDGREEFDARFGKPFIAFLPVVR